MKPWYTSKTIWLNAIAAALVAIEGVWGPLFPDHARAIYIVGLILLAATNAALRVITTQAIGTTGDPTP